jgi:hypothetical protein
VIYKKFEKYGIMEEKQLSDSLYLDSLNLEGSYFVYTTLNPDVAISYAGRYGILMVISPEIIKNEIYFRVLHDHYQEVNFISKDPFPLYYVNEIVVRDSDVYEKILEVHREDVTFDRPLKYSLVLIEDENELKTYLSKFEGEYLFRGEGASNPDEASDLIKNFLSQNGFGKKLDSEKVERLKVTYDLAQILGPEDKIKSFL